ncbi:hypothetical protein CMI47_05725 [Candidatus Pacearchaeota archaeon]|nr:hypothetical protein [Candidatus Pacearchaeota archaeon]|tara:strand:- start:492 stop:773 length:282 start_codon:yes stop_codon:yes gene_type:complete
MKRKVKHFFVGGDNFKKEFRKQLRLLILITLSFTIAFAWRQTIFDIFETLILHFINVRNSATASVLTSLAITLMSLLVIYLASNFLKDRPDYA